MLGTSGVACVSGVAVPLPDPALSWQLGREGLSGAHGMPFLDAMAPWRAISTAPVAALAALVAENDRRCRCCQLVAVTDALRAPEFGETGGVALVPEVHASGLFDLIVDVVADA